MTNEQTAITTTNELTALQIAGQVADSVAANHVFDSFRQGKSDNTLRAHDNDLDTFTAFLIVSGVQVANLNTQPDSWQGVSWGLVEAFKQWMVTEGYSINSINRALSTVKVYAKQAFKAGAIDATQHALIKTVTGFTRKEGKHVNERRETQRRDVGSMKKSEHVSIPVATAKQLKLDYDNTPQGRRDSVLMCLLIDLGLRCSEIAGLTVGSVNLQEGTITFNRPKVDKVQTHDMPHDLLLAMKVYADDMPIMQDAPLLRGSRKSKDGKLSKDTYMSTRAITKRVKALGKRVGLSGLSAHDCRHYWATQVSLQVDAGKVSLFRFQEAGGWSSLAMPRRYVETAKIANKGIESV